MTNKNITILDSVSCSIHGLNLIEASAGTGKTYNIQNIFVRMIMESGYSVESILVVTFTDAATQELKNRIRSILTDLKDYFDGRSIDDLARIKALADAGQVSAETKHNRVVLAIQEFDKAAIFTIHSFCKKILDENVFNTAAYFNQELQTNNEKIIEEITYDYIRNHFYKLSETELFLLNYNKITPISLIHFINRVHGKSNIQFDRDYSANNSVTLLNKYRRQIEKKLNKERIFRKLSPKVMKQNSYKPEQLQKYLSVYDKIIDLKATKDDLKLLDRLTPEKIKIGTKKDKTEPTDELFELTKTFLDNYETIFQDYHCHIYFDFYHFFMTQLEKEKKRHAFRTYNDLIVDAEKNLSNTRLLESVRQEYAAVLIDEFQDTDTLQYSIFSKIFIQADKPCFLIGDPKQAIYSFRGGDIYAYKNARQEVAARKGNIYTLPTNYRSTKSMVQAINDLYTNLPNKKEFFNDFITFYPVTAQPDQSDTLRYNNRTVTEALDIFFHDNSTNDTDGNSFSINQTVNKILTFLNNDYQLYEKGKSHKVVPSDIAVLVNTHKQAESLLPTLKAVNIPAVVQTSGSVFDSEEAVVFDHLIAVIEDPSNLMLLRGVLTTFLFDTTAENLYHMTHDDDEDHINAWIVFFRTCKKRWQQGSFIEAFNFIVKEQELIPFIKNQENGERKLTNLFHLQELIQTKEQNSSLGIAGIKNWFSKQLDEEKREKENDIEVRLETDDDALKIMTIHKSKGLEFPIVFCPFLWSRDEQIKSNDTITQYHDENNQKIINLAGAQKEMAERENMEEAIRLAYVALTRAKYKAVICSIKNKKLSVEKYFLTKLESGNIPGLLAELKDKNRAIKSFDFSKHINFISIDSDKKIPGRYLPQGNPDSAPLVEKKFTGNLKKSWSVNSFSSLARPPHDIYIDPDKDYDELDPQKETEETEKLSIFNFPAGAKVGSCWHSIFEEIEFSTDYQTIREKSAEKLLAYGLLPDTEPLAESYIDITTTMVHTVLNATLSTTNKIILKHIKEDKKITEMEFYFSVNNESAKIKEILSKYNIQIDQIPKGFLLGYIDLVFQHEGKFYILDWKSNSLGNGLDYYSDATLSNEMTEHQYTLQYLLYTVALHKFLKRRLPNYQYEQDFGGVFYIFLRGVSDKKPGSGVYYDLPDKTLITKLETLLS